MLLCASWYHARIKRIKIQKKRGRETSFLMSYFLHGFDGPFWNGFILDFKIIDICMCLFTCFVFGVCFDKNCEIRHLWTFYAKLVHNLKIVEDWNFTGEDWQIVNCHGFDPEFCHGIITCDFVICSEFLNVWEILDVGFVHSENLISWVASRILSQSWSKFSSSVGGKSKSAHEEKMSVSKSYCDEVRRIENWSWISMS